MKTATFTIARPDTGAVLPLCKVTVYQADGATRATIYSADGRALGNPITADQNGSITFAAPDGTYVLSPVSSDGTLTVPLISVDVYDLPAIQTAAAASATQAMQAAAQAQGGIHMLPTTVSAGGTLPLEVTALSGSFVGTGSGGTPGEYALTVSGSFAGHTAFITVGSDGKIASARIGSRGIAVSGTAAPTYALPSGTGLTGATLPTATVTALAADRIFYAPNANSGATQRLAWQSSGGVIAAYTIGGVQWVEYFKPGIDAFVTDIYGKLDIYQDYTYGAATIAATGTANAANTARWYTAAIGRTGPLTQFEIAGEGAGTVKVIIQRPNAGTPANWDNVISFSLTIAAGVNTFTRTQIETAAGGQVNITSDMRIGLWSASAIISLGTGSTFVSATRSGDPTGLTNFTGTAAAGFVIFRATVNALTDTPVNSRVQTLQAQQAVTDTTLASYRGALTAGYDSKGEIVTEAIWGTGTYNRWMFGGDVGTDINLAAGESLTHVSVSLQTFTSATTQVRLTAILRDLGSGSLNNSADQAGDVVYGPYTYGLAALGLTPGTNVSASCRMALGSGIPQSALTGKRVYFRVEGLDNTGALSPIGTGRSNSYSSAIDQGLRGWFGNGTGTSYPNSIASPNRQAWRVEQSRLFGTDEIAEALAGISSSAAAPDRAKCSRLRGYRIRRARRLRPTPDAVQNILSIHGTSWTQSAVRYSGNLASLLIAEQGDAGGGWTGFGFYSSGGPYVEGGTQPTQVNGNVRPSLYTLTYIGAWTSGTGSGTSSLYGQAMSVDQCCAQSSTAGNVIKAAAPSSWPTSGRGVDLHWVGTADGVMEYSWDGSSWTTINVQGTVGDASFASLAGVPSSGAVTLHLRVVSGTCKPAGINWKSSGAGLIFHKLAASGQNLRNLAAMAANTSWRNAYASLGTNTALLYEGTNDQNASSPTQFATDIITWATGVRASDAGKDILVAVEAENQRTTNVYAMKLFAASAWNAIKDGEYAWFDTQSVFGSADNPGFYAFTGPEPMMSSDGFHPEPSTGGAALEQAWLEVLNRAP